MNPKSINDAVKKVIDGLPEGMKQLSADMQKNVHDIVLSVLDKLDVVTREEFDAQQKVLQKTRAKLEKLEGEIERLYQDK